MTEENGHEFEMTYNGRTFIIDADKFCLASDIFKQIYSPEIPGMSLENYYDVENFKTFLCSVQNLEYEITNENVDDLYCLSKEWDVPSLQREVERFKTINQIHTSATNLLDKAEKGLPTEEFENEVVQDFNNVYEQEAFLKLPIPIMRSVLKKVFERRVEFQIDDKNLAIAVNTILDTNGEKMSDFFEALDFNDLPDVILRVLLSHPNFNRGNIAEKVFVATQKLLRQLKAQRIAFADEVKQANAIHSSTEARLNRMKRDLTKLAEDIDNYNDDAEKEEAQLKSVLERTKKMEDVLIEKGEQLSPAKGPKGKNQKDAKRFEKGQKREAPKQEKPKPEPKEQPKQNKSKKQNKNKFAPYVPSKDE
jgi:hypothetical protein